MKNKFTNQLINESSPYLLQHAHNPVNWIAWSDDVYEIAKKENKLILISVGYSSCHWCHVMEHECFESEEVAAVMNQHFICVKVDREERPDIDQIYMTAVQLTTQRGGWPLNCFTLPDGRPIYGGTYFPKDQWIYILNSLQHTWEKDPEKAIEYAEKLHEGIEQSEWLNVPTEHVQFSSEKLHEMVIRWSRNFDNEDGGYNHAPKFPMPNNYLFLLRFAIQMEDKKVLAHVELTLDMMAKGGIYDQIGGGFSRYSVDAFWKVPHFEKMLYDNAQLLSLYAQAYKVLKKPLYKQVIDETMAWLDREMLTSEGAYYSALDADSEGEEGKFYCWSEQELKTLLGEDFQWVSDYYAINPRGYWEDEKYILLRQEDEEEFAKRNNWQIADFHKKVERCKHTLLSEREKRIRPGLDDKCLTAWNALLLKGFVDVYAATGELRVLEKAEKLANWLQKHQVNGDLVYRTRKNGVSTIHGFLEDYATVIDSFIALYELTFEEHYLASAKLLCEKCLNEFHDPTSGLFFFTPIATKLISRKIEVQDNVIPASNSILANCLFKLGHFYRNDEWIDLAKNMLAKVYDGMEKYGAGYSNWAQLLMNITLDHFEVVIIGADAKINAQELNSNYIPNSIIAGGTDENLPLLTGKIKNQETRFSICTTNSCYPPVNTITEALQQLKQQ